MSMDARAEGFPKALSVVNALLVVFAGCNSTSGAAPAPDAAVTTAVQRGRIVDFTTTRPVAGATITAGSASVQSGADGTYALTVVRGAPFAMNVTAADHVKLIEQSSTLDTDADRGDTLLVSVSESNLLKIALDGYDPSRGVLALQLIPVGSCKHVAGAKVHVSVDGARIMYFAKKLPKADAEEASDDELPTAVLYNLPVAQNIDVAVDHPSCKKATFPYVYQGVAYGGDVQTEPGDATSFARYFLE